MIILLNFFKSLYCQTLNEKFWENGAVMISTCLIVSIIFIIILWIVTVKFTVLGWRMWLPVFVCTPCILFGAIMIFFPNGTWGMTQHFYLGILMYALCILTFTSIGEGLIVALNKLFYK